jgi:hypothetical protein
MPARLINPHLRDLPVCPHSSPQMSSDLSIAPPPIYAQQGPDPPESVPQFEPQILIIPATDSLRFQQGFLGADGERAAIEGELQVKGTDSMRWRKVSVVINILAFLVHLLNLAFFSLLKDDGPPYRRGCV